MIIELSERKQTVLEAIIREFLNTAEPVGSRVLCRHHIPDISPATIRNEMADLEEAGFIKQPHTSAGRVPTDIGYRFFVDHLMKKGNLTDREHDFIHQQLSSIHDQISGILHQTAKVLSSTLQYTAIVVDLKNKRNVYSSGIANMLKQPEFQNVSHMQKLLELVEKEELLSEMIDEYSQNDEVTIRIGAENKFKQIKDCSVAVIPYKTAKRKHGALGIIGPTRMFYNKVKNVLECVSKELEELFE